MRIILDSISTRIRDRNKEYIMIRISPARRAVLWAMALCAAATAAAANTPGKQSIEQQQIQALQQQLAVVQAQMKQLAEQNQTLLQKQLELERQVTQQGLATPAATAAS